MWTPWAKAEARADALEQRVHELEGGDRWPDLAPEDAEKSDYENDYAPLLLRFGGGSDGLPLGLTGRHFGGEISTILRRCSAVMACVEWVRRVASSTELQVRGPEGEDDTPAVRRGMEALGLLGASAPGVDPNVFFDALWQDVILAGNAFWLIRRSGRAGRFGAPRALRYLPPHLVYPSTLRPGAEPQETLSDTDPPGWSISTASSDGGQKTPEEIVRVRWSVDPFYPAMGLSPLFSAYRESMTDVEASSYSRTVLQNFGLAGTVISPEIGGPPIEHLEATTMQNRFQEAFSGARRGGALVSKKPVKLHYPKPEGLAGIDLSKLRNLTEERVCALLGISPAVIGLGTGLQSTKVGATMQESVRISWRQCLIPIQDMVAHQLSARLMPEFGVDPKEASFRFDRSAVTALQETPKERAERQALEMGGAGRAQITVNEARSEAGREMRDEPEADEIPGLVPKAAPPMIGDDGDEDETAAETEAGDEDEAEDEAEDGKAEKARVPRLRGETGGMNPPMRRFVEAQEVSLFAHTRRAAKEYATDLEEAASAAAATLELRFASPAAAEAFAALRAARKADPLAGLEPEVAAHLRFLAREAGDVVAQQVDTVFAVLGANSDMLAMDVAASTTEAWAAAAPAKAAELAASQAGLTDDVLEAWRTQRGKLIRRGLANGADEARVLSALAESKGSAKRAAEKIARHISGGRYKSSLTRARVIARTEAQWLQRESVLQTAEKQKTKELEVLDGLLPTSDDECVNLNGARVSPDEARVLHGSEHPQGTRDFVPVFG